MVKMKKMILIGAAALMMMVTPVTANAETIYKSPAQIAAEVTGKTVDEVIEERIRTGKSFGTIAAEAGKLEEFQKESLEVEKKILQERVKNGTLTQEQADNILASIEERQAYCDGTGYGNCGYRNGRGCGGRGRGQGNRGNYNNGYCYQIYQ